MIKLKIWGEIGPKTSYIVEQAISEINDNTEPVIVVINSIGGLLSDAVIIANLLKSIENPVITVAMGNCISAAAMIFAVGQKRYVVEDLSYMIHQPYSSVPIPNLNYSKLSKTATSYKKSLDMYLKYVIKNDTCIPVEKLDEVRKAR